MLNTSDNRIETVYRVDYLSLLLEEDKELKSIAISEIYLPGLSSRAGFVALALERSEGRSAHDQDDFKRGHDSCGWGSGVVKATGFSADLCETLMLGYTIEGLAGSQRPQFRPTIDRRKHQ